MLFYFFCNRHFIRFNALASQERILPGVPKQKISINLYEHVHCVNWHITCHKINIQRYIIRDEQMFFALSFTIKPNIMIFAFGRIARPSWRLYLPRLLHTILIYFIFFINHAYKLNRLTSSSFFPIPQTTQTIKPRRPCLITLYIYE